MFDILLNTDRITLSEGIENADSLISKTLNTVSKDFLEMTEHLSKAKGKGVRTQLLLTAAMQSDGRIQYAAARAAAAVELLHLATLVHDDVIDNAPLRRGVETLHIKFGKKSAVICGDYLLSVAMKMVSDLAYENYSKYSDLMPNMTGALSRICEGQYKEILANKNLDLSIFEYLRIISGKTASLFYVSAFCGAVIGDCEKKDVKSISLFGKYLGVIFQMLDDCKDFEWSEAQAKKPVLNDMAEGVVTLPLIFAVSKSKELKQLAARVMCGSEEVGPLIKDVIRLGSIKDTRDIVGRYRIKAEKFICDIDNRAKRNNLIEILDNVQRSV